MYFTQKKISMYFYDDVSIVLLPTAKDTREKNRNMEKEIRFSVEERLYLG
jgi:hypothetical protein